MNVGRHMQRDAVTALPSATVGAIRRVMDEHGFGLLLITAEDGRLQGFVTRASLRGAADDAVEAMSVLHPVHFAVVPADTLEKAALIMLENRLVLLPVVENDRLVGVITQGEVLRGLADGLGIGLEGTRMEIQLRKDTDDLYRAFEVLREHGVHVVSMASQKENETHRVVVLRLQGIADREALREALEARLREAPTPIRP
jgi:acetoin utilization protein AcuB